MASIPDERIFFDAGMFIGALLQGDDRHTEARTLVEAARRGEIQVCTSAGILSEVYGALTWQQADPPHSPAEAEEAVRLLIEQPSAIQILSDNHQVALRTLKLAAAHNLTARRIHDARHAATALESGVAAVYTYDVDDWKAFEDDGIKIIGPESSIARLEATQASTHPEKQDHAENTETQNQPPEP